MNRLQIVQRLRQEAGVAGNGPVSLANLTGELKRLNDWADAAWLEIQGLAMWDWRWSQPTMILAAGGSIITTAGRAARQYGPDTMRLQPSGQRVECLPWAEFRERHPGALQEGIPSAWTVAPDRSVRFNAAAPAGGLIFTVEAYATPVQLAADTEEPAMPEHFHLGIVWLALQKYSAYEEAGTLYQTAEREWNKVKRRMELECMPDIELGGALC